MSFGIQYNYYNNNKIKKCVLIFNGKNFPILKEALRVYLL